MAKEKIVETLRRYVSATSNQIHSFSESPIEITALGNLQNYEKPDGYFIAENTLSLTVQKQQRKVAKPDGIATG